ncbi:MAG: hypothetical protein FJX11_23295 [Alphaproteobacteria bacterium]|nr:hypothetical protein [Alphaproteobacteria bacterium]
MESVTALVACGAAFALSYYIGHSMASTAMVAAMMGAVCGLAFVILFFISTVTLGALVPDMFDGWTLGVHFIVLLAIVPLGGAGIAVLEHRHLRKIEARRLPF